MTLTNKQRNDMFSNNRTWSIIYLFIVSIISQVICKHQNHHKNLDISNSVLKSSKSCQKTLQGIVYKPEPCAYNYVRRISKEFQLKEQIVFTPQVTSFALQFAQAYYVYVYLIDAVGKYTLYEPSGQISTGSFNFIYSFMTKSYLNLPGFSKEYDGTNYYGFDVFSPNGLFYNVVIFTLQGKVSDLC